MFLILYGLLAGLVLGLLFLNVYFRVKVMDDYKYLVRNRVEFRSSHVLNKKKMEREILPNYPDHADRIRSFCKKIGISIRIACIIVVVITLLGGLLMYYK